MEAGQSWDLRSLSWWLKRANSVSASLNAGSLEILKELIFSSSLEAGKNLLAQGKRSFLLIWGGATFFFFFYSDPHWLNEEGHSH